jgi:hypothetical protein
MTTTKWGRNGILTREFDRGQSLEQLEHRVEPSPSYDSYLVKKCHSLRRKPICDFTVEDLRIMIGQGLGVPFLLPLAIEQLERNPIIQGDFYPGDLLRAVIGLPSDFWTANPALTHQLRAIIARVSPLPQELRDHVSHFLSLTER